LIFVAQGVQRAYKLLVKRMCDSYS
jgi:hypothetical protein